MKRTTLTAREQQVLAQLKAGATYKDIAHALAIAHSTARVIGARALRKRGLSRRRLQLTP